MIESNKTLKKRTDWNSYHINPSSLISKYLLLNFVIRAYTDLFKGTKFKEPIKILEFGSGTGYLDLFLAKKFKVKKITAIDFNEKMINVAKKTLASLDCEKQIIHSDLFKFRPKEQYDIVHSQGVIEHFEPKERCELLKRHYNATKKGGYCVIYFPTPSISYRFFRKISEILRIWKFYDETPLKKQEVVKNMKSLGFKPIRANSFWRFFLTEHGFIFKK